VEYSEDVEYSAAGVAYIQWALLQESLQENAGIIISYWMLEDERHVFFFNNTLTLKWHFQD
jgi:hypothetical protein